MPYSNRRQQHVIDPYYP